MRSLILETTTRVVMALLILFSVFLLWRGHNEPGGGFAGGLVLGGAFALYGLAYDFDRVRRLIRMDPRTYMGLGLLLAAGSGILAPLSGHPFMTGLWHEFHLGFLGELPLGTPFLFDVGVYVVVFAVTMTVLLTLAEEAD